MPSFKIAFPDEEELLAEKSFRTYKNYLKSIELIIETLYGSELFHKLKLALRNDVPVTAAKPASTVDLNKIKKLLFNAWYSEIILYLPNSFDPGLKFYSNHWAPVQAYYSVYLSLRSLIESSGVNCREDHTNTLNLIASWIKNDNLFLPPWNACCKGCVEYGNHKFYCLPDGYTAKEVSTLTNPSRDNMWDFYSLMLRTTRDRILNKRKMDWKRKHNRKRMLKAEIFELDKNIHPTTIFDSLYRLRIRSNYEDADAFMMGTQTQQDAENYHKALVTITGATLFTIETCIMQFLGKDNFKNLVDEFKKRDPVKQSEKTIKTRADVILS
ncbi:MAG: hypothetical protein WC321_00575 [Candidatus Omnitrophota bacterium]|jgi:hypothetical protein